MAEGMLSLSWNNHSSTFCHMLSALREVERYTDVTVACEGKFYPVHKLVLSTCSDYFLKMFECTPCKHPVIVLKDVQSKDMEALLSYMYAGIVSVAQSDLAQLIKAAELLQIKGLAVPDEPPVSNRRGRNTADDSDSPHPKRHKRQDQNLGEHQSGDLSSPRSPVYDDDLQEDKTDIPGESPTMTFKSYHGEELADRETSQSNSRKDHRTAHQTDNKVEDEASLHERHLSQVVTMVDDTLIKEEMVEEGNDSGMTDTVFDYSNLEADMGLDDHEAGENQSGLMVPGRYDHQRHDQSFLRQFHQSESSSDARPGPSLLHGWQNPGDIGESSGGQGYTQEAPLPGHMDSHSLYPLRHGGRLPLRVCAVPEGTVVPTKNVLFTVESTDPMVPWVTNYFETIFVQVWYPMTVATNSRIQKQIIHQYLKDTHDNLESLPFLLHDFGYRGASSVESAAIGGASHLVNFKGTDTIAALAFLRKYYHSPMAGFSIPASEHSTVTTWGRSGESSAFRNMMEAFPDGAVACVSDSYDIWKCCEKIWGEELRDAVIKRGKNGGTLLIRPDSGDPPSVVLKCLEILGKAYGTTVNSKGYKLLPPYLRVIQGDGISYRTIGVILENLKVHGWCAANVVFGSGGSLLQKVDRDTQKCAYKCSYAVINGEGVDVYKQPISDPSKTSKKGRLALHHVNGTYVTLEGGRSDPKLDVLVPVFENGELLKDYTLEEIREKADLSPEDIDVFKFLAEEKT